MPCDRGHVVVTGASTGIGRATVLRLVRAGFHVFATVRRPTDGQELQHAAHGDLTPLRMDVLDPGQVTRTAQEVTAHVGGRGLDALVNNAGVGVIMPLELIPLETFRWQFQVNVDGQLAVTQALLPLLRQAAGRIIMIGSVGGRITMPFMGPLAAAKHALRAVTDALRQELAPWGIRVVLIEPASVRTAAIDKAERDTQAALETFDAGGRARYGDAFARMTTRGLAREQAGSPPDVVAAVVACAITSRRPRPRYLTGKDARRIAAMAKLPPAVLDALRRRIFDLPKPGSGIGIPAPAEAHQRDHRPGR